MLFGSLQVARVHGVQRMIAEGAWQCLCTARGALTLFNLHLVCSNCAHRLLPTHSPSLPAYVFPIVLWFWSWHLCFCCLVQVSALLLGRCSQCHICAGWGFAGGWFERCYGGQRHHGDGGRKGGHTTSAEKVWEVPCLNLYLTNYGQKKVHKQYSRFGFIGGQPTVLNKKCLISAFYQQLAVTTSYF
jgi:hypothetical protein